MLNYEINIEFNFFWLYLKLKHLKLRIVLYFACEKLNGIQL